MQGMARVNACEIADPFFASRATQSAVPPLVLACGLSQFRIMYSTRRSR